MNVIERFTDFYENCTHQSISQLSGIYANNICLIDPVAEHNGLKSVERYFSQLLLNTVSCQCSVQAISGNESNKFVTWNMRFVHPKLNGGRTINVEGITHLKIQNDLIVYHRDFYDMGQMVYEHIPLLRSIIKTIKHRIAK